MNIRHRTRHTWCIMILGLWMAVGCNVEENPQQNEGTTNITRSTANVPKDTNIPKDMSSTDATMPEEMLSPTNTTPLVDMSMTPDMNEAKVPDKLGPLTFGSCARPGAKAGPVIQGRWTSLKPRDTLIMIVSGGWIPSEPLPQAIDTGKVLEVEAKAKSFGVLAGPYQTFTPGKDRAFGPCSAGRPCPLLLVKLQAWQLQAWMNESCGLAFVESTAFDCVNHPDSCEEAKTCRFYHGMNEDLEKACLWNNVSGCSKTGAQGCSSAVHYRTGLGGECWIFRDSCLPRSGTFGGWQSCERQTAYEYCQ